MITTYLEFFHASGYILKALGIEGNALSLVIFCDSLLAYFSALREEVAIIIIFFLSLPFSLASPNLSFSSRCHIKRPFSIWSLIIHLFFQFFFVRERELGKTFLS